MTYSKFGPPSLNGARSRVRRVDDLIVELRLRIQTALQTSVGGNALISVGPGMTGGFEDTTNIDALPFDAPEDVSVLVGEIVQHLRVALEYLVYELAYLDVTKPVKGTKFIIETCESSWNQNFPQFFKGPEKAKKKLWLHKLHDKHQVMLKSLQPFGGCEWPLLLRELSNKEKHCRLIWVATRTQRVVVHANPSPSGFTIPSKKTLPDGVKAEIFGDVMFRKGLPVLETLDTLKQRVAEVIASFEPDFH